MFKFAQKHRFFTTLAAGITIMLAVTGIIRTTAAALQLHDTAEPVISSEVKGIDGCDGNCAACGLCTKLPLPSTETAGEASFSAEGQRY